MHRNIYVSTLVYVKVGINVLASMPKRMKIAFGPPVLRTHEAETRKQ